MNDREILLVEDNEDDIELTMLAFRKNGINNPFIVLRDGVEAIEYMLGYKAGTGELSESKASLVLLDLNLPKINGLEVLKNIRSLENTRLMPVIVLSTSRDRKDILSSYNLGANSYLIKPVDFEKFVELVSCIGTYWLSFNELPY